MIRSCIVFLMALGVLLAGCSTDYSKYIAELDKYTKILEETARLLHSPVNAKRLLSAVARLAAGQGNERELAK